MKAGLVHVSLHDGWTVRAVAGEIPAGVAGLDIPATVPGCVHLDLLAAGVIPDPYLDDNEAAVAWVGRVDWRYATSFEWQDGADDVVELVALGLDTVATIELNGTVVAQTQNMHRSYRFPVSGLLRAGRNELSVTFEAGVTAAQRLSEQLGPRPHVNTHPFNALRKMACNYGWDWGPDLVTAGIWRPLELQSWSTARLQSVRPLVAVDAGTGRLSTHVELQRDADVPLTVEVEVAGVRVRAEVAAGQGSTVLQTAVPDVQVWWPHGYGDQPRYPVTVTLADQERVLDQWQGRVGFRTIELNTTPDEQGIPFALSVNGVPFFARGANWIPDDCFPSRVDRNRYAERIGQARDGNVNLLRVWGGGIYESEDFYDCCDELGVLVWQDFLFACAAYAEEEPLRGEVIAEAREAVTRLSAHPSLAVWNGCNENIWGYYDWGWQEPLADRSWGWGYYTEVLPAIVAELDPTRPYSPGSPYSMSTDWHPNDPDHGTMHIWDVWNERDYTVYRDYIPRFCAEFGFQGPPTWSTLTRSIHEQPRTIDSPVMLVHQKAEDGNGKLARGLQSHLPPPESFEDWHWATSLNQARAVAFGLQHFRSWSPRCSGAVVWQLNDCWPVTSWAAIDGDGRRKPLWYAMRHSYSDRLLTIQPRSTGLAVVAVNDAAERWTGTVEVSRRSFDGTVLAKAALSVDVEPRATLTLQLPADVASADDPARELILADAGPERAWWHFVEDVDAALPAPSFDAEVEQVDGGYRVQIRANSLLRDLAPLVDRLDPAASVDRMLVTLLPGEAVTFTVRTAVLLSEEELTDPLVLRSANQLVQR